MYFTKEVPQGGATTSGSFTHSLKDYISSQQAYMDYEKNRNQDYYFLSLLTSSNNQGSDQISPGSRLHKAEDYLCRIIEYIKSIKNLNKRRQTLNCQFEKCNKATPIMIVIEHHKYFYAQKFLPEILEFIIKNGADIRIKDDNLQSVFHYLAKYSQNLEPLKVLRKEDQRLQQLGLNHKMNNHTVKSISITENNSAMPAEIVQRKESSSPLKDENIEQIHISISLRSSNVNPFSPSQSTVNLNSPFRCESIPPSRSKIPKKFLKSLFRVEYHADKEGHTPLHLIVLEDPDTQSPSPLLRSFSHLSPSHFSLDCTQKLPVDLANSLTLHKRLKYDMEEICLREEEKKIEEKNKNLRKREEFRVEGVPMRNMTKEQKEFMKRFDSYCRTHAEKDEGGGFR